MIFCLGSWTTTCGGSVGEVGINYPAHGLYSNNLNCQWTITKTPPYKLIIEKFDLELSPGCKFDYLQIDDGTKMCGSRVPSAITVEKSPLAVTFRSDRSGSRGGFMMRIVDGK